MSALSNMVGQVTGKFEFPVSPVVQEEKVTKASLARSIFVEMYGKEGVARKDIIGRFIKEAGLTEKGAATYYQNMVNKRRAGKL